MKTLHSLIVGLFILSFFSQDSFAVSPIQVRPVHFAKGTSSATLKGNITGSETIDYTLRAKAGQNMDVNLQTSNASNYFNVLPPGSETALFVGSTSGNHWSGNLPSDGDYRIRVYLMRNAARRNEGANYTLTVGIHGKPTHFHPSTDAKVPGTNFHATGKIPCSMGGGQPAGQCDFGVTREGNGSGIVTITKPDGGTRSIIFKNGKAIGYDQSQADSAKFSAEEQSRTYIIHIGPERYEIIDSVIYGG
jgi:hypothetical protein